MSVISKELFYEKIDVYLPCKEVHFWHESCIGANFSPWWMIRNVAWGSAKFFLPIYTIKMLYNYKKIKNKKFLKSIVLSELRSTVYGMSMGFLIVSSICALRNILGRFYYHTLLMWPGFISGLSLLLESEENHQLDTLTFFNSFIETVLNRLELRRAGQTLAFMLTSGLLMHLFHNRSQNFKFPYLWFYTPAKVETNDKTIECKHDQICEKYAFEGFYNYFVLGYGVNIIRKLVPRLKILFKQPSILYGIAINKANLKFGLFIGGYVGLYRILICKLKGVPQISNRFLGLISGILSGMTYWISPNLQVLVIALTTLCQLFYHYLATTLKITNHYWQRQLLFMVCHGYLLHQKFFIGVFCSPWYSQMIDACTNNQVQQIYNQLMPKYFL